MTSILTATNGTRIVSKVRVLGNILNEIFTRTYGYMIYFVNLFSFVQHTSAYRYCASVWYTYVWFVKMHNKCIHENLVMKLCLFFFLCLPLIFIRYSTCVCVLFSEI